MVSLHGFRLALAGRTTFLLLLACTLVVCPSLGRQPPSGASIAPCSPIDPGPATMPEDAEVSCVGIVTSTRPAGDRVRAVIQSGPNGMVLMGGARGPGIASLKRGEHAAVRGKLRRSRDGSWQVEIASAENLGTAPEPAPYDVMVRDLRDGAHAQTLVRISGTIVASGTGDRPRLMLRDRTGELPLALNASTLGDRKLLRQLSEPSHVVVIGVAGYPNGPDDIPTPVLRPRDAADFTFDPKTPYALLSVLLAAALLAAAGVYGGIWIRAMRRHNAALTTITNELRQSESALRRSERLYRSVTETASDAILTVDDQCRIAFANPATEAMFGWTAGELTGQPLTVLLPEICRPPCESPCRLAGCRMETLAVDRDGHRMIADISMSESAADESRTRTTVVVRDVTERKRAENEIRRTNGALTQLSRELLRSQDAERRRIAHDLHDGTNQNLAALKMNLSLLQDNGRLPEEVQRRIVGESMELIDDAIREIRSLSCLLHPPLLEELGLDNALLTYIQGFRQRTGIRIEFDHPEPLGRLTREAELTLFRIVQEALANVHRHSGSKFASIRLEVVGPEIELEIRDCARVDAPVPDRPATMGVGLLGTRERAEQLGGRLTVRSVPGGTTILVRLPLDGDGDAPAARGETMRNREAET
jgi:PAS domain S-box-containing protein